MERGGRNGEGESGEGEEGMESEGGEERERDGESEGGEERESESGMRWRVVRKHCAYQTINSSDWVQLARQNDCTDSFVELSKTNVPTFTSM